MQKMIKSNSMLLNCQVVLGSSSPRRKKFFEEMGIDVVIKTKEIEEHYPDHLQRAEITDYLAKLKASPLSPSLLPHQVLITSDTLVWFDQTAMGKPKDTLEAHQMLSKLSGNWHEVYTSVCFTSTLKQEVVHALTHVKFNEIDPLDIEYYISTYQPFDKAGSYGIQEWIGLIGVEQIKGSYNNVVGLPTALVYKTLTKFCNP